MNVHLCCYLGVLTLVSSGSGVSGSAPEYEVKAAYVYNFAKFIEWPSEDQLRSVVICIYGRDPFGGFLDEAIRGRQIHCLPVRLRRLDEKSSLENCQVLFVGVAGTAQREAALKSVQGRSTLTIGESESFAESGGMIGLVRDRDRVLFDINIDAITAAHLHVSSHLIQVARVVKGKK